MASAGSLDFLSGIEGNTESGTPISDLKSEILPYIAIEVGRSRGTLSWGGFKP